MNNKHMNTIAVRKAGIEGWEPFQWEVVSSDVIAISGGIPRLLKRGPRKGQKTWDGKVTTEFVTKGEMAAEFAQYEARTGNCGECLGEGQVFAGWHHIHGDKHRQCDRCGGSGRARGES